MLMTLNKQKVQVNNFQTYLGRGRNVTCLNVNIFFKL